MLQSSQISFTLLFYFFSSLLSFFLFQVLNLPLRLRVGTVKRRTLRGEWSEGVEGRLLLGAPVG